MADLFPDVGSMGDWLWNAATGRLTNDQVAALKSQEAQDLVRAGMGEAEAERQAQADQNAYVENLGGGTAEEYAKASLPALTGIGTTALLILGLVGWVLLKAEL